MKAKLEKQMIVKRVGNMLFSQLDDELLAIDSRAGFCYSLNETAGRVWDLIASPLSIEAVCTQLRREYAVDESTSLREVTALLGVLSEAGLVEIDYGTGHERIA